MRIAHRIVPVVLLAALVSPLHAHAQSSPRDSILVTPEWLSARLGDPNLVILHVGPRPSYDSLHIPGARFVDLNAIGGRAQLSLEIPPLDSLRGALQSLGISDDSRIVITQGAGWVTPATRVLLTLDHAGLGARTVVLDGGVAAWSRAGFATTTEAPAAKTGTLSPLRTKANIVTVDAVREASTSGATVIIDARAAAFYDGVQEGGSQTVRKRGHIPGAKSIPFTTMMDSVGKLVSPEVIASTFGALGLRAGSKAIMYCHIGQQATLVVLAARSIGIDAKLYDGSFEDWVTRDLPVAVPPAPGRDAR